MAPALLYSEPMDPRAQHRHEIEALALKRFPVAAMVLVLFIGGAFPVEWYYYPEHLPTYLGTYLVETLLCALAYQLARRRPHQAQAIAAAWAGAMGVCIAAYYPLVEADATLATAALICLVAAMPAIMPFGVRHQAALGGVCAGALAMIMLLGTKSSLPVPYVFISLISVVSVSSVGAHAAARFRWEAFQREANLHQAHDHLRTALARAESAAEMRSRLVANVSHELRTPLNVIVGYADMLIAENGDPDTVAEAAPRIRNYAVSLEALVTELLDLSRLSSGKVELTPEDVDVRELLEEIAESACVLGRGKPIRVLVECNLSSYRSDRMRLRQILHNLATNAVKFTDCGTITLRARANLGHVTFEVQDTGRGIPDQKHEEIFTAFEQVSPQNGSGDGIGLGLALVRQLCDVLGGTVTLVSREGVGSTFTVSLPGGPARTPEQPDLDLLTDAAPAV